MADQATQKTPDPGFYALSAIPSGRQIVRFDNGPYATLHQAVSEAKKLNCNLVLEVDKDGKAFDFIRMTDLVGTEWDTTVPN